MDRPRREPIVGKWWVFRLSLLMRFVFLGDGKKVARAIPPPPQSCWWAAQSKQFPKLSYHQNPPSSYCDQTLEGRRNSFLPKPMAMQNRFGHGVWYYWRHTSLWNRMEIDCSAFIAPLVKIVCDISRTCIQRLSRGPSGEEKNDYYYLTHKKNDRGRVCGQPRCSSHDVVVLGEEPLTDWVRPALHFWREEWGRTATILRVRVSPRSRQSFRSAQKGWRNVIASVAVALCTLTDTL